MFSVDGFFSTSTALLSPLVFVAWAETSEILILSSAEEVIAEYKSAGYCGKLEPGSEGHYGMVTSLSTKSQKASARAGLSKGFLRGSGGMFLSAGVDWTVKMWAPAYGDKPLLSLVSHSYDYMSDVKW